ncbi:unnamed protein product [Prorocentrum cordatum]|uniref:Kazal-like domain-containing protein n=1 Tax=Prorocentrum cordatum TaxID=2364126 RepID=A0ABN9WZA6_9DINO|nr:unnamed protein product [Polarella glacialis]
MPGFLLITRAQLSRAGLNSAGPRAPDRVPLPMVSATARSIVAVVLLFALAAEGKVESKFWGFLDDVAGEGKEKSDVTTVAEILEHGGSISVEDCGTKTDVMHASRSQFYRSRLQVRVYGNLSRSVSGGTIGVKIYRNSAAEGSSTGDWMKRELAWHSVPHSYEEDLCKHFGKSHSQRGCPLLSGTTELRFAIDKLPPMVVAGSYRLKIKAVDTSARQVACVRAHVDIPRGKSGEVFRRVQAVSATRRGRALELVTRACSCDLSDPVCGDDGNTYESMCQAHCARADVAYPGKCGDQVATFGGRAVSGATGFGRAGKDKQSFLSEAAAHDGPGWSRRLEPEATTTDTAEATLYMGPLGTQCSEDQLILSPQMCELALMRLGTPQVRILWYYDLNIPRGCSYRPGADTCSHEWCISQPHSPHFSRAASGQGREDLQPVCGSFTITTESSWFHYDAGLGPCAGVDTSHTSYGSLPQLRNHDVTGCKYACEINPECNSFKYLQRVDDSNDTSCFLKWYDATQSFDNCADSPCEQWSWDSYDAYWYFNGCMQPSPTPAPPPTPPPTPCVDTSDGAVGPTLFNPEPDMEPPNLTVDCELWVMVVAEAGSAVCEYSFAYDDSDFTTTEMCCACGGGSDPSVSTMATTTLLGPLVSMPEPEPEMERTTTLKDSDLDVPEPEPEPEMWWTTTHKDWHWDMPEPEPEPWTTTQWDWDDTDDWDDMDDCWCDDIAWPVCGNDGTTYSSSCYADCLGGGVWMDGECDCIDCTVVDAAQIPTFTLTFLMCLLALLL